MDRNWKVGELAKLAGLTERTLRYYDRIGLFSPSARTESGHRRYVEEDLARLQQVLSLKEYGLSLVEIKSVMEGKELGYADLVNLQMIRIRQNIVVQQKLLKDLERVAQSIAAKKPLNVEEFLSLFEKMKKSKGSYVEDKRAALSRQLDQLAVFLDRNLQSNRKTEDGKQR